MFHPDPLPDPGHVIPDPDLAISRFFPVRELYFFVLQSHYILYDILLFRVIQTLA